MTTPYRFTHKNTFDITPSTPVRAMRVGDNPCFHRAGTLQRHVLRGVAGSWVLVASDRDGAILIDRDGDVCVITQRGYVEQISYDALTREDGDSNAQRLVEAWRSSRQVSAETPAFRQGRKRIITRSCDSL